MFIDFNKIPVVVLTIPSNTDKLDRLKALFENKLKFDVFYGVTLPKPIGCDISLIKLWNSIKPPILVLEDDCCPTEFFKNQIEVPDDADVVHIGTSGWGVTKGVSSWNNFELTKYNDDFYKIAGMTSTHGMLFLNNNYLKKLIEIGQKYPILCEVDGFGIDYFICQEQHKYNIYAVSKPFVYQNDGFNEGMTNYALEDMFEANGG
jgi:GR25 family glycosyltransferase involved in LPS biosynthesis